MNRLDVRDEPKADPVAAAHKDRLSRFARQLKDRAHARRVDAEKLAERLSDANVTSVSTLGEQLLQALEAAGRLERMAGVVQTVANGGPHGGPIEGVAAMVTAEQEGASCVLAP